MKNTNKLENKRINTLNKYLDKMLLIKEKNSKSKKLIDNFNQLLFELCIDIENNLINKSYLKF